MNIAKELKAEMEAKQRDEAVEEFKREAARKEAARSAADPTPGVDVDMVKVFRDQGLDISPDMLKDMKENPSKVTEMVDSMNREKERNAMYPVARCEGCRASAAVLISHVAKKARAAANADKATDFVLSTAQALCDAEEFPDDFQLVPTQTDKLGQGEAYAVERNLNKMNSTNSSTFVLRRVCREVSDEVDEELAEAIAAELRGAADAALGEEKARAKLEKKLCKRACGKGQRGARRAAGGGEL